MEYQLITPGLPSHWTLVEQVFYNRGFKLEDIEHYLHTTDEDVLNPLLLENMEKGAKMLIQHIANKDKIFIQVDSDCDGFTSAAILINYLNCLFPSYTQNNVCYRIHTEKQHGLIPSTVPKDVKLVILPDSSSNDYEEHAEMVARGIDVLVLDHHHTDKVSEDACVINNQTCDYPTKSLSGAGVVYKFCSYIDTLLGENKADQFLDLAALGMVADMVDLRDCETRRLIERGIKNVNNPFFSRECSAQNYSIQKKGGLMPFTISFYVAPFVNATIRMGSAQQKMVLFESMLSFKAYEQIESTKRGAKGQTEPRVEQAVRNCNSLKTKQNNNRDAGLEIILNLISQLALDQNPVVVVKLKPEYHISKTMTGLIANIISNDFKRPCLILNRVEDEETKEVSWEGSARGYEQSALTDFRKWLLDNCPQIMYAEGHPNAFGVGIKEADFQDFETMLYDKLRDFDFSLVYKVDAIYQADDFRDSDIVAIGGMRHFWGKMMDEPYVAIERIKLTPKNTALMSKDKSPTLKITLPNGVSLIKFGFSEEEYNDLVQPMMTTTINVVGYCRQNAWNGRITGQIEIEDFEVLSKDYDF